MLGLRVVCYFIGVEIVEFVSLDWAESERELLWSNLLWSGNMEVVKEVCEVADLLRGCGEIVVVVLCLRLGI